MNNFFEKTIEKIRPSLTENEREHTWTVIHANLITQSVPSPYKVWTKTHLRLVAGALTLLLIFVGGATSALANEARPGDLLFPLDRALERVSLAFTFAEAKRESKGQAHAEERLTELRELIGSKEIISSEAFASSTQQSVSASVDALMTVMEESRMSDVAREQIYEKLFFEIDPLSLDVRVDDRTTSAPHTQVHRSQDSPGKTRIEITKNAKRTRVERKNGSVKIEYNIQGEVEGAASSHRKNNERKSEDE